jgi:hypothetical protein
MLLTGEACVTEQPRPVTDYPCNLDDETDCADGDWYPSTSNVPMRDENKQDAHTNEDDTCVVAESEPCCPAEETGVFVSLLLA